MSNIKRGLDTYQSVTFDLLKKLFENKNNVVDLYSLFKEYKIDNYERDEFISFFLSKFVNKQEFNDERIESVNSFIKELANEKNDSRKSFDFFREKKDSYIPSVDSLKYRFFHPPVPSNPLLRFE